MASRNLKRAAESPSTPRPSNIRRMAAADTPEGTESTMPVVQEEGNVFEEQQTRTAADLEANEAMPETSEDLPAAPEQEEEEDDSMMMGTPDVPRTAKARISTPDSTMYDTPEQQASSTSASDSFNTPVGQTSSAAPQKGLTTLRRKTEGLFLSKGWSSDPFDPEDDEYDQGSPSLHSKELQKKAKNLFTGYRESKDVFSVDSDEVEQSSPIHKTMKGRGTKSINSPPNRRPKPSAGFTSSPMRMNVDGEDFDVDSADTPKMSTLRKNSAALLGAKNFSSSNPWDADEEEFDLDLGAMRLDGSGRVRSKAARSMRASLASSFKSTPSQNESDAGSSKEQIGSSQRQSPFMDASKPNKQDLEQAVHSFVQHRGTFKGIPHNRSHRFEAKQDISKSTTPVRGENLTAQQKDDYLHELADKNCGNPRGIDAHDEVMKQFYKASYRGLPVSAPSNIPHLLDYWSFNNDNEEDDVIRLARPRLGDAVATVLFQTSPKCLADFLNPDVKTFEWRRDGNCIMIRRVGNEVIVGTFNNFGTMYLWPLFVRCKISEDGAWEEVYAGAAVIKTPLTAEGVKFDEFVEDGERVDNVDPENEKYALHMGRVLGKFLLQWTVWDFREWRRWVVFWETDGVVTDAKEHGNEALRLLWEME